MKNAKQIQQRAQELYKQMDWLEIDEHKKRVIILNNAQDHDTLLDLTYQVSEETSLSRDSAYRFTMEALAVLADIEPDEDTEDLRECSQALQADIYTSDLTEWLNESNNHVYYLTQILEEFEIKDGFALLAEAQRAGMVDAFDVVLDFLQEEDNE